MPGAYAASTIDEVVEACKQNRDEAAWEELLHRTHRLVAASIINTARNQGWFDSAPVDDLVQDVYLKISDNQAALLRNFQPQHPNAILGYLRAIASSVACDYRRSVMAEKRGGGKAPAQLEETEVAGSTHTWGGIESIQSKVLLREIDETIERSRISRRDREIFWLHHHQGMTSEAIASLPGLRLTTKGVDSTLLRLFRFLRNELGSNKAGKPTVIWRSAKASSTENPL